MCCLSHENKQGSHMQIIISSNLRGFFLGGGAYNKIQFRVYCSNIVLHTSCVHNLGLVSYCALLSEMSNAYYFKQGCESQGVITSVPKNSFDVVPIEIMCLQRPSFEEMEEDDLLTLKSMCGNVFHSIASGKKHPPTIAKYQQNFRLIIEEAVRSNLHLFTDDEKFFLGRAAAFF